VAYLQAGPLVGIRIIRVSMQGIEWAFILAAGGVVLVSFGAAIPVLKRFLR